MYVTKLYTSSFLKSGIARCHIDIQHFFGREIVSFRNKKRIANMPKTRCMADRHREAIIQEATLPRYRTPSLKDVGEKVKRPIKLSRKSVEEDGTKVVLETRTPAADTLLVLQGPAKRIAAEAPGFVFSYGLKYCHKCWKGEVCFIAEFYECYIAKYEMFSGLAIFQGHRPSISNRKLREHLYYDCYGGYNYFGGGMKEVPHCIASRVEELYPDNIVGKIKTMPGWEEDIQMKLVRSYNFVEVPTTYAHRPPAKCHGCLSLCYDAVCDFQAITAGMILPTAMTKDNRNSFFVDKLRPHYEDCRGFLGVPVCVDIAIKENIICFEDCQSPDNSFDSGEILAERQECCNEYL